MNIIKGTITRVALAMAVMVGTALVSYSAHASTITINNPSFETLALGYPGGGGICGPGCTYSQFIGIPGWTGMLSLAGQIQPGSPINTSMFDTLPDGPTVGYVNTGWGSILQTVGTALAGITYTLTVDVGFRHDIPDYSSIGLQVGSNLSSILTMSGPQLSGTWVAYTVSYTAQLADDGQPLSIQLVPLSGQGVYNSVSLTATSPPQPLSHSSPRVSARWVCFAGVGSERTPLLSLLRDQNT